MSLGVGFFFSFFNFFLASDWPRRKQGGFTIACLTYIVALQSRRHLGQAIMKSSVVYSGRFLHDCAFHSLRRPKLKTNKQNSKIK